MNLLFIHIVFFSALLLTQTSEAFGTALPLRVTATVVAFVSVIILPAFDLTLLLRFVLRRRFTLAEHVVIMGATIFIGLPVALAIEVFLLRRIYPWLPALNALLIFALLTQIRSEWPTLTRSFPVLTILRRTSWRRIFFSPILAVSLFFIIVTAATLSAYYALPDLDPYTWVRSYGAYFSKVSLEKLPLRPLFYFLGYLFLEGVGVERYAYFKYLFPFLSSLIILPAWLVAQQYRSTIKQVVVLLIPFTVPSTILYQQHPIPQTVGIILTYYFFFFLVYSHITQKKFFYYFAGILAFISYFYHEASAAMFCVWLLVTLLTDAKNVVRQTRQSKLVALLLVLLVASNIRLILKPYDFIRHWIFDTILPRFTFSPNWRFPAHYINIDQNQVGWPGALGVTKYYLFYVGPTLLVVCVVVLLLLMMHTRFRQRLWQEVRWSRSVITIALCFMFFFTIAEVLPRLISIAVLPDRAWAFAGIFASVLYISFFRLVPRRYFAAYGLLIILSLVSCSGALYINNLKKYRITDAQITSAFWLKKNLPPSIVVLSGSHVDLLTFYAESTLVHMPISFYCNPNIISSYEVQHDSVLKKRLEQHGLITTKQNSPLEIYQQELRRRLETNANTTPEELIALAKSYVDQPETLEVIIRPRESKQVYIYYAEQDSRDLNTRQPSQIAASQLPCETPVFDSYPQQFKKVYDDHGKIKVWEWL